MTTGQTTSPATTPTMPPPPVVQPSGSPQSSPPLAPSLTPTTDQPASARTGFSGIGDFFQGLLRNFSSNNPTGTGTGATVGTIALSALGLWLGGVPGLLIGAGAGFLGGGVLNHLAVGLMSTFGMRTPAPPSFTPTLPERQPVDELAEVRPLSVEQPGASPVQTTTIVPRTESYRQLENLSLSLNQYRLQHGTHMSNLGDNIRNRLNEIRRTTAGPARTKATEALFADQRQVYQFMENTAGWNALADQWNRGDRIRLDQANGEAAGALAIDQLVIPEPPVYARANRYTDLIINPLKHEALRIYRPDGVPAEQREAHFHQTYDTGIKQLQFMYQHLDGELERINSGLADLERQALDKGRRSVIAGLYGIGGSIDEELVGVKDRFDAVMDQPVNNASDAAYQVSRIMRLTPNDIPGVMPDDWATVYTHARVFAEGGLEMLPPEGGDSTVQAQRQYFQAIIEKSRLETLRQYADGYFSAYATDAERGYNSLVRDGQFQQYSQQVELIRQQVELRSARMQELNQLGMRFTGRGQGVDENHRWVTVQTGNDTPPVLVTLAAEARGEQWVVTHAYNGPHNDAADRDAANALAVPLTMTDIFTPSGMLATTNLGNTLRQSLVQLNAAKPSVNLGTFQPGPGPAATVGSIPEASNPVPSDPAIVPPTGLPPRPEVPATVEVN